MGTLRMRDLLAATGVTARVVRFYVQRGVLPPPDGRGTGPVYSEEHLLRLRAARRLRAQRVPIPAIIARLSKASPEELGRLAAPPTPANASAASAPGSPGPAPAGASATDAPSYPAERWERLALLPGLELHLRADAGPLVRRLAAEIYTRYSTSPAGPPSTTPDR